MTSHSGGDSATLNDASTVMSTASRSTIGILDPLERMRRYGLEVLGPSQGAEDGIIFRAGMWKTGGEYTQKMIVRNVSTNVRKFKYTLPRTTYFSMMYPETTILSPGMFVEIDVIFRPVNFEPYDDSIYFKMMEGEGSGGFHFPVKAFIDKLVVEAPDGLDLNYCPIHQTTSRVFKLFNVGEVKAPFRWESPLPYVIEPMSGVIPIGKSADIRVSIYPLDASVFVSQAVCHIGEGEGGKAIIPFPRLTTRFSAIGKYTFLSLSDKEINYGEVLVGTPSSTLKKETILRNSSPVVAEFSLIRHEHDNANFDVQPREGVIPPLSSITVTVKYSPLAMGTYSVDRYSFKTPSGSRAVLTCRGQSIPPSLTLYKESHLAPLPEGTEATTTLTSTNGMLFADGSPANSINFRDVEAGRASTRVVFFKNDNDRPVPFSLLADDRSAFQISPRQGVIPALFSMFPVTLTFSPKKPINFYRRIFVLVGDALPQFIDCMGSGYVRAKGEIKEQRPWPLRHAHVQAYLNRVVGGLSKLSPEDLFKMYEDMQSGAESEHLDKYNVTPEMFALVGLSGTRALSTTALQNPLTRSGEASRNAVAVAHELFIEDDDVTCRDVTISSNALEFPFTPSMQISEPKTVRITNHTSSKIMVYWRLPEQENSAQPGSPAKSPKKESSVVKLGDPVVDSIFEVDPPTADINAGQTQKFTVYFKPKHADRNYVGELEAFAFFKTQRTFRLVNDPTMSPPWCLPVTAIGHSFESGQLLAKVSITGGNVKNGLLVFPATFTTDSMYQTIMLRNLSNLPATFKLELGWEYGGSSPGKKDQGTRAATEPFSVKPSCGEIAADGFVAVCIRFSPQLSRKYSQLLRCIVNNDPSGQLLLEGTSSIPFVFCPFVGDYSEKPFESLGIEGPVMSSNPAPSGLLGSFCLKPTSVGLSTSRSLVIKNGSRVPLRYTVSLSGDDEALDVLSLSVCRGVLKGNEMEEIPIAFAPRRAQEYMLKLKVCVYALGGASDRVVDARQPGGVRPPQLLQTVSVQIVAPGEVGALIFDPPRIDTGVQLVNTQERRELFLENFSDSDIAYKLFYKYDFSRDNGDKLASTFQELCKLEGKRDGDGHVLFCERPLGILPARSRTLAVLTFQPDDAGLFDFSVSATITAVDSSTGKACEISNEESALLRVSQAKREQGSSDDAQQRMDQAVAVLAEVPLMASITGRASYPTLVFEDMRMPLTSAANVEQLWRNFDLSELNLNISLPLTRADHSLNAKSSPAEADFKRFQFQFSPAVLGSPSSVVKLQIKNNGFLTSNFHVHLANEKELNLEQWCDEDDPSEALNRVISIIEELKCFSFEPRRARLLPGESVVVTVSYNYTHLKYDGEHRVPVLMKIDNGKQFYIDLAGTTLALPSEVSRKSNVQIPITPHAEKGAKKERLLLAASNAGIVRLASVPLGLAPRTAPRQRVEISNPSAVDLYYDCDTTALDRVQETHHNMPIFALANPSGVVRAHSRAYLEWYFHPLEAVEYTFSMNINYYNAETAEKVRASSRGSPMKARRALAVVPTVIMTMVAVGYDTRAPRPLAYGADFMGGLPSSRPLLTLEGQQALASADLLDFGLVPQNCSSDHMLILKNLHASNDIEFEVHEDSFLFVEGLLGVFPAVGTIACGSVVVLSIKFRANCSPLVVRDILQITVREVIVEEKRRRGAVKGAVKSAATGRGARREEDERSSVVFRSTTSQSSRMSATVVPKGRTPSLPTTMSRSGELMVHKTADLDEFFEPGAHLSMSDSGSVSGVYSEMGAAESKASDTEIKAADGKRLLLLGAPQRCIVRIAAEVYAMDAVTRLFSRAPAGSEQLKLANFIMPRQQQFIPANTSSLQHLKGGVGKDGSKTVRPKVQLEVDRSREQEVRAVAGDVLGDLFRSLLDSAALEEAAKEVLPGAPHGLSVREKETSQGFAVDGRAAYGVYFSELVAQPSLLQLLVQELCARGFVDCGRGPQEAPLPPLDAASLACSLEPRDFALRRSEVLPAFESLGLTSALYPSSHRCLKAHVAPHPPTRALASSNGRASSLALSNTQSNATYSKPSDESAESNGLAAGNAPAITLSSVLAALPADALLGVKECVNKAVMRSRKTGAGDDEEKGTAEGEETDTFPSLPHTNALRGRDDGLLAASANACREALLGDDGEFLSTATEVLQLTMYNLLQEAAYGEFAITAEPLAFMTKQRPSGEGSIKL